MNLERAKQICADVAAERKRWGRHASTGNHRPEDVLDALMTVYEAGMFDAKIEKEELTRANRAKGVAEARAKRYKAQLDHANQNIRDLTKALEETGAE